MGTSDGIAGNGGRKGAFYPFTFLPSNILLPFLPGYYNRYASQDSEDAYRQLQRETLAEDAYADDDGCYWLILRS